MHVNRSDDGPRDAPRGSILFVHGFPLDSSVWTHQLAALPAGWHALAPDLRGFGRSPLGAWAGELSSGRRVGNGIAFPDEPVLTMDRLADDMAALIEKEVGRPAVICGLSMGGYVALSLWRRRPDLVRALVLADTRAETDSDEARENRRRTAQLAREEGARPVADAMIGNLLAPATLDGDSDVVDRVRRMILATPPATLVAALAGLAARHDATGELPHIDVPTLVVVGEQDAVTPPAVARSMADAIPGARLAIIPGAGHLACLEAPEAFNQALAAFLDGIG